MRFPLRLAAAVALALLLGLGSAAYLVYAQRGTAVVSNGSWTANLAAGSTSADPYTRTYIALVGVLALGKDETIYYGADKDSAGAPLAGNCSYRIEGRDPDARWWSITLYGRDHFLIPNAARRYSVSKTNVVRAPGGGFVVRLSTTPEGGNWLATSRDGFQITLRLYNPGLGVTTDPATVELPTIVREACT